MKRSIIYITESPGQTKKLGELLARTIAVGGAGKRARVLALRGDLGAGKTNFTQGLAAGLGIGATVNSPTFAIMKKYPLKDGNGFKTFYHIDCYRLESAADLAVLGVAEILNNSENIIAIEWPEVVKEILPKDILKINFEVVAENNRRIIF